MQITQELRQYADEQQRKEEDSSSGNGATAS